LRQSPGFRSLPSMGLERRPLPSTGVTRLQWYYEPHRHPRWPGLSLAGVRLRVTRPHRLGLPVLRWISVYRHAVVITPVARWVGLLVGRSIPTFPCSPAASAFPILVQGRRTHWTFRGLLDVHSRYGLPARCIAKATHVSRRLRRLRYLHRRSDSYRPEQPSCRVGVAPTEDQHLCTAHIRNVPPGPARRLGPPSMGLPPPWAAPVVRLRPHRPSPAVEATAGYPRRRFGRLPGRRSRPGRTAPL
jgi:hypothetical protein